MEMQPGVVSAVRGPQGLPLLAESVRQPRQPASAVWASPLGWRRQRHVRPDAPHRKRPHEKTRRRETLRRVICECCSLARYASGVVGNGFRLCRTLKGGIAPHLLLEKGVGIATVSERLGHSSVATTAAIYSHAIRGKDRAAAQVWDDIKEQARAEKPGAVFLLT